MSAMMITDELLGRSMRGFVLRGDIALCFPPKTDISNEVEKELRALGLVADRRDTAYRFRVPKEGEKPGTIYR